MNAAHTAREYYCVQGEEVVKVRIARRFLDAFARSSILEIVDEDIFEIEVEKRVTDSAIAG